MRKIFFIILFLLTQYAFGQLSINILMPSGGIMGKQQLWNFIATNTEMEALSVQAQIRFSEINSGQTVFVASSSSFIINPGTMQLTESSFGSILYNVLNPDYRIDPGPAGLLPVGSFNVCYEFLIAKYNKIVQQCQQINIPPLGPLLLIQPSNESELEDLHPTLSWLPPSPVNSLNNLRYELRVVEMLSGQSGPDAIQNNIPLFIVPNLTAASFACVQNASDLQVDKKYAWQIVAMNNHTIITKSDVWSFSTKKKEALVLPTADPVYIKLKKEEDASGSAIFWGNIRFDYLNETGDTEWNILIEDLTSSQHKSFIVIPDSLKLRRGQNLVNYEAIKDKRFIEKHQYLLKIVNSRNEVWQLRFEYRKPD